MFHRKQIVLAVLPALALALVFAAPAARADHDGRDERGGSAERRDRDDCDDHGNRRYGSVWIRGHYETRVDYVKIPAVVERRVIPAVVERVWVPEVCEEIRIAAVTERVWVPGVMEREWVPAVVERVRIAGHYESYTDALGCARRFEVRPARVEDRIVTEGHWVSRCVREGRWETRIVSPERCERRVVRAGYFETRVVCAERCEDVVVRAERVEKRVAQVWVPGRWESAPRRL